MTTKRHMIEEKENTERILKRRKKLISKQTRETKGKRNAIRSTMRD